MLVTHDWTVQTQRLLMIKYHKPQVCNTPFLNKESSTGFILLSPGTTTLTTSLLCLNLQDMEKHGHLLQCFNELRLMLQTPIKPYNAADKPAVRMKKSKPAEAAAGSGDEDEELTGPPQSPTSSPQQQSSSDGGSDLEELLGRDFPHEDLPSLITRAVGKGNNIHHHDVIVGVTT